MRNKKLFLLIICGLVLTAVAMVVFVLQTRHPAKTSEMIQATFLCKDDRSIGAEFISGSVALTLSDGRRVHLNQTISGFGARYANSDESFIFWNKGDSAFIEEKGKVTYSDCMNK